MKKSGLVLALAALCLLQIAVYAYPAMTGHDNNQGNRSAGSSGGTTDTRQSVAGIRVIKDVLIFRDTMFYPAFPSAVRKPDGELIVAFRCAPDRKIFGEPWNSHVDPNSYLVRVTSKDGENWTRIPELIYAHPFGGSQDPCLLQLRDGTLLCTSYGWAVIRENAKPGPGKKLIHKGTAMFLGGYIVRSTDGGKTWQGPFYPVHIPPEANLTAYGTPVPAYNRGALYEARDGRILWVVAAGDSTDKVSAHLIVSYDKGLTWMYSCPVASDSRAGFNETSVYETPKGDIVAFLRTDNLDDQACIARSTDGGRSFEKWQSMGFQGHPLNALRLPDNRVLLTYGYRHEPFGIRARVLNPECTDFATAPEIILRKDGGNGDIGYSWPVMIDKNRILVVYYFNNGDGISYIAGTILETE